MSRREFETELRALVGRARQQTAPIHGAYSIRSPDTTIQDYDVEITKVANSADTSESEEPGQNS